MGRSRKRPQRTSGAESAPIWKPVLLVACALGLAVLLWNHVEGLNGSAYWFWWWRMLPSSSAYPVMALCALPLAAGLWVYREERLRIVLALGLVSLSTVTLQVGSRWLEETGTFQRTSNLVNDAKTTSYFTDATELLGQEEVLGRFHERSPDYSLHSRTHPPGPILYYMPFIWAFEDVNLRALTAAFCLVLLTSVSVPATYVMARGFGATGPPAFYGACVVSLMPSLLLFAPLFDPAYIGITGVMLGAWAKALRSDRARWALLAGGAIAVGIFFSYALLTLGAFIVALAGLRIAVEGPETIRPILSQVGLALAAIVVPYALLWLVTGFDPIQTFLVAVSTQADLAARHNRPWPTTIPSDLQDFARGAAWLPILLLGFYVLDRITARQKLTRLAWIVGLCVLQVAIVAGSGLLRVETARVWAFLVPLVAFPAGLELANWSPKQRWLAFAALWLVLAVMHQTIVFPVGAIHPSAAP
ncbi:MAG: hypothetical protein GY725_08290 [bacterium]|nr:hypothetical protein [bacterium]